MTLVRWDPFRELSLLQNSISKLFDENFGKHNFKLDTAGAMFPVDIKETPEAIILKADLPGVNKQDISVDLRDNVLTIRGERKTEEKEEGTNFVRVERSYGTFRRSFTIDVPVKVDEIRAGYQDGILEITMPKEDHSKLNGTQIQIN